MSEPHKKSHFELAGRHDSDGMGWASVEQNGPWNKLKVFNFQAFASKNARELLQSSFQEMNLQKFRTGLCSLGFRLLAALLLKIVCFLAQGECGGF